MKFFDNIFRVKDNNYYGVSGLSSELSCIYIYNSFLACHKNVLVITNSLYEANLLYSKLSNYTDKVLFFPMDDFITSEAIAISPEFKSERIHTLNCLVGNDEYIVITNLMGVLRYLPKKDIWRKNILYIEKGMSFERDSLVSRLYDMGYERESIVTETGKLGVRGYVLDIFPIGLEEPIRVEFWGDEIDSIKTFDLESQLTIKEINSINIEPFTEFLLDEYPKDVDRKQKYLKYYAKEIGSLWEYVGSDTCFWYDYNQIEEGYRLLRETIFEYDNDRDSISGIKTDYMYDLKDISFKREIFLLNFDNILANIKLNFEDRYVSNSPVDYNGNLELISRDLKKFLIQKKTIIICVNHKQTMERVMRYLEDIEIFKTTERE